MERKFEIDGRVYTGEVRGEQGTSFRPGAEGFLMVAVDGVEHRVEVMERSAHHLDLILDGERRVVLHTASTGKGRGETWVGSRGRTRLVREVDARAERGGGGGIQRLITPQFPAKVVKIHVELGQPVTKNQPVVTVSAMKMEMTLTAPYDGTVTAINTQEGDNVNPGEILVEIEEASDE